MGITNDTIYYLKKNFSRFTDLFSNNLQITNYVIDSINDIATITTAEKHNLRSKLPIFIDNVFYCYNIASIKSFELDYFINNKRSIDNVLKITTSDVFFNAIKYDSLFYIGNLSSNSTLNGKYRVLKSEIILNENNENQECVLYCLPLDVTVNIKNIDIINEGLLKIKYTDDTSITVNNNKSDLGVISRMSGCYNGFKIVHSIVDENTFTVQLPNLQTRPDYSDIIDFSNGVCKANIKIYPCNASDIDILLEKAYSTMKENKKTALMFLTREDNESTNYGTSFDSTTESINTGLSVYNSDSFFTGTILFRVERDTSTDGISHLVLDGQANDITDELFKVSRLLINNLFVNVESELSNEMPINALYKSVLSSFSAPTTYADVTNGVFKIATFSFKVSKFSSGYNSDIINNFGLPIENINIGLDFNKNDSNSIEIN